MISKRQAKKIVARRQGEKSEINNKDDIIADLTDDEELAQELRDLATGKLKLSQEPPGFMAAFNPDDSYYSEDE